VRAPSGEIAVVPQGGAKQQRARIGLISRPLKAKRPQGAVRFDLMVAGASYRSKQYPCPGNLVTIDLLKGKGVRRLPPPGADST